MTNLAHEMSDEINAKELAKREGVGIRAIGIPYAKFRAEGHPLFASQFDCNAPLSPEQIALLRPGKFTAKKTVQKKIKSEAVEPADIAMTPELGQSNEVAPQGLAVKKTTFQKGLLLSVCALCATASVSNMLDISMQIKGVFWAACVITAIFTLSPFAVFYAGVRAWVSWLVSGVCIGYEVFCNSVGIYRGLSGLGNGLPYEVWEPGGFIDSVSRVTTVGFKPCALGISFTMAGIIAGLFLVCLNELKK